MVKFIFIKHPPFDLHLIELSLFVLRAVSTTIFRLSGSLPNDGAPTGVSPKSMRGNLLHCCMVSLNIHKLSSLGGS